MIKALMMPFIIGLFAAIPAFAAHEHYLVTPDTTVSIAKGQTLISDPNYGVPRLFAFNQGSQVIVDKVSCH